MSPSNRLLTPVLIGGSLILLINFALRASFGVFQIPVAETFGWPRSEFSMAIAIQNLAWGVAGPFAGMLADRFGAFKVLLVGGDKDGAPVGEYTPRVPDTQRYTR